MHTKIQRAIGELLKRIGQINLTEADLVIAEELMPEASIWLDDEVNINWPCKSMDEVKLILRKFAQKGIMLERFVQSSTSPVWKLHGKAVTIRLCPHWYNDDSQEGVTCKLIQVGVKTEEVPIYKLVCDYEVSGA